MSTEAACWKTEGRDVMTEAEGCKRRASCTPGEGQGLKRKQRDMGKPKMTEAEGFKRSCRSIRVTASPLERPKQQVTESPPPELCPIKKQAVGLKTCMLPLITVDNLTPQMKYQVFLEIPEVRRDFLARVPWEMSEDHYWNRYCKVQDLHLQSNSNSLDCETAALNCDENLTGIIFGCNYENREDHKEKILRCKQLLVPMLDFDSAERVCDGYVQPEATMKLIRSINRHGDVVLQGVDFDLTEISDGISIAHALTNFKWKTWGSQSITAF